jgi:hypothetical protein
MAKRGQHSFLKRQKEIKRKEEAAEKMARRHGKGEKPMDGGEEEHTTSSTDNEAVTQ